MQQSTNPPVNPSASAEPKFILRSKTVLGALLMVLPQILAAFGVSFSDLDAQQALRIGTGVLGFAGVVWGRMTAAGPLHFGREALLRFVDSLFVIAILTSAAVTFVFGGCASLAKFQADPRVQSLERAALQIGVQFAVNSATGGNGGSGSDQAWAITQGLHSITDAVRTLPNDRAAQLVRRTAIAFTGSKSANVSIAASQLAHAFAAENPQTAEGRAQAVQDMAAGIASALQSPVVKGATKAAPSAFAK